MDNMKASIIEKRKQEMLEYTAVKEYLNVSALISSLIKQIANSVPNVELDHKLKLSYKRQEEMLGYTCVKEYLNVCALENN